MGYLSKKIGALEQSVRVVVISNSVQKFLRKVVLQLFANFFLAFPQIERIYLQNKTH